MRRDYDPRCGRPHRSAGRAADVDPLVVLPLPAEGRPAHPVLRIDLAMDGPAERQRTDESPHPTRRVLQLFQARPFLGDGAREQLDLARALRFGGCGVVLRAIRSQTEAFHIFVWSAFQAVISPPTV